MAGREDTATQRHYKAPYTTHRPIPTVQRYRQERAQRGTTEEIAQEEPSWTERAEDAYKTYWKGEPPESAVDAADGSTQHYQSTNKNLVDQEGQGNGDKRVDREPMAQDEHDERYEHNEHNGRKDEGPKRDDQGFEIAEDTSEAHVGGGQDPKEKRKQMKKRKEDTGGRQVTDPVTHLPVMIHDFTKKDLNKSPENEPTAGTHKRSATGNSAKSKDDNELREETAELQSYHTGMEMMFPPPNYDNARIELEKIYQTATTAGLGLVVTLMAVLLALSHIFIRSTLSVYITAPAVLLTTLGLGTAVTWGMRDWVTKKVEAVWEDEVWESERQQGKSMVKSETPESTQWLNSLMASIWPLVNPDLFVSMADTLEDVMQASLPKLVRMVSVEDLGQGSEALRILGVRWLPTGAAAQSVSQDGKLRKNSDPKDSDRTVPGQGEIQSDEEKNKSNDSLQDNQGQENIAEGMEAEEGDFVNMEVAFAYRARTSRKGIRDRAKNAHLYLAFYLPGNIKFRKFAGFSQTPNLRADFLQAVWVELHGLIGTVRLRLQLTPDPPFFSLCTLTFLGQPKVDVSCIPLTQKGLNIMDLPLISNFVQSSVDAAMAEYVAPKSLTLDLKDMLMGDDFKKDTAARGVIVVRIKRAYEFKEGDSGMLVKKGSTDGYISVGWAKFAKPLWSTRIIQADMEPCWDETCFVLVTSDELNVQERLRVQLWDSDRHTADDDLGRIEVDIKQIMKNPQSDGKMQQRVEGFKALQAGESMPGKLEWEVGYFSKTRIMESQLKQQTSMPEIRTMDQLQELVDQDSERKLRESKRDESAEFEQLKAQDFKEKEDQLVIAAPPPHEYPSGILSITIHQISGLELEALNKKKAEKHEDESEEEEESEDLPSSYCTIILNHQKVFRTRTKPKNAQPFFNAGCERFIRDWRNTDIHIGVRDARVHEDDTLLGIVYLPLGEVLKQRSQINSHFPLLGGVGYGRMRISMVFRSVQLQAPQSLLGWDFGTLEVAPEITGSNLPSDLLGHRLKVRTTLSKGKMHSRGNGAWSTSKDRTIKLPVRKRYASPLIIEFRKARAMMDPTVAFAVFWLKDMPDNEETTVTVPVWKGGDMKRATTCCLNNCGEQVGTLRLSLVFWSGISSYHAPLAARNPDLGQVMEVLETAGDNEEMEFDTEGFGSDSSSSSSDSSTDTEDEADDSDAVGEETSRSSLSNGSGSKRGSRDLSKDGKRGPISSLRDYKHHRRQLHRRNRGVMQWKGPRTLQWMKHKLEHGEQHIADKFGRHTREPGIETEA